MPHSSTAAGRFLGAMAPARGTWTLRFLVINSQTYRKAYTFPLKTIYKWGMCSNINININTHAHMWNHVNVLKSSQEMDGYLNIRIHKLVDDSTPSIHISRVWCVELIPNFNPWIDVDMALGCCKACGIGVYTTDILVSGYLVTPKHCIFALRLLSQSWTQVDDRRDRLGSPF